MSTEIIETMICSKCGLRESGGFYNRNYRTTPIRRKSNGKLKDANCRQCGSKMEPHELVNEEEEVYVPIMGIAATFKKLQTGKTPTRPITSKNTKIRKL